jgi:restriction endonuclease Mrr
VRIDIKFLEQYPEFVEFRTPRSEADQQSGSSLSQPEPETPEEALETAHLKISAGLASEVLARLKSGSPQFFEQLVVELLLRMGYGGSRKDAGQAIGKVGDEGIMGLSVKTVSASISSTCKRRNGTGRSGDQRFRSSSVRYTANEPKRVFSLRPDHFLPKPSRTLSISIPRWFS